MKRILMIAIVLLQTLFISGQTTIEQYECVFPQKFIFQSTDKGGYNVTKNFIVEAATLTYKSNKIVGFTLKSKGNAKATYNVVQMISETSHAKRFWVTKSGKYFVVVSFPLDVEYGMKISFISNIDGSVMFDCLFKKILTAKEKELLKTQKREHQEAESQKKSKDMELLKSCLSSMENRKSAHASIDDWKIANSIEQYEIEFYKIRENRVGDSSYDFGTQKRITHLLWDEVTADYKLLLYISQKECKPVRIDSEVLDDDLYRQYNTRINPSYTLNGITYYQVGAGFFFEKQFKHQMLCGRHTITIKKKKSEVVYYKGTGFYKTKVQEEDLPLVILNKIQSDITERGTYGIDYIFVNDSILRFNIHK
ncbi:MULTISPECIES: hypothetical protein [Bacteroidales]|jgi:hypothetical protein|nr:MULTISPECIES: hypothetical protein [Bacteroidales]